MSDIDLEEYSEVTELNFDGDVHLAVTGRWQQFSANRCLNALMVKSGEDGQIPEEIIKSLEGKVPEQVLVKMSYSNMRRALSEAIESFLRENMSSNGEYIWVNVYDFNDDMVAFRFQEQLWAVDYEASEDGVVTIGQDLRVTSNRELYVDSETGEELIKASFWRKEENPEEVEDSLDKEEITTDGEIEGEDPIDTPDVENKEDDMSDKEKAADVVQMTQAEMQEMVKAAIEADRIEQEELRKAAELKASTTELVKGLGFVEEGDVEELVKSLVAEGGEVLIKTLSAAKEKVESLQSELEKGAEAPEEVKKEEKLEKGSEKPEAGDLDRTAQLAEIVKAKLAAKK